MSDQRIQELAKHELHTLVISTRAKLQRMVLKAIKHDLMELYRDLDHAHNVIANIDDKMEMERIEQNPYVSGVKR